MNADINQDCTGDGCPGCEFRSPLFEHLSHDELIFINKHRYELSFKAGEIIRKQGAYLSHVISIKSGLASLYIEGLNNRNVILKIVKPTNFIGGPGMFVHHRHHYSVKAHQHTTACFIEVDAFKEMLRLNHEFADGFFTEFSRNTLITYDRLLNFTQKYIPGRMADALIYLSQEVYEDTTFNLVLSKKDMGDFTGMSTDSVIRVLRTFKNEGIISMKGKQFEIKDMEALKKISNLG
nr:Crp/Fnr family transcriptional regulator [Bacteroidota bacterium]